MLYTDEKSTEIGEIKEHDQLVFFCRLGDLVVERSLRVRKVGE